MNTMSLVTMGTQVQFQLYLLWVGLVTSGIRAPKRVLAGVETLVHHACVLAVEILGTEGTLEAAMVAVVAVVLGERGTLGELSVTNGAQERRTSGINVYVVDEAAVGGELLLADMAEVSIVETLTLGEETQGDHLPTHTTLNALLVHSRMTRHVPVDGEHRLPEGAGGVPVAVNVLVCSGVVGVGIQSVAHVTPERNISKGCTIAFTEGDAWC